jgi:hypothetical protein
MGEGFINSWSIPHSYTPPLPPLSTKQPLEWAVGFFFGNTELSLELWNVIAGISGFDD